MQTSVGEIAARYGGIVIGDDSVVITNVNSLDDAGAGEITFLGNPKYASKMDSTQASAVLVPNDYVSTHAFPVVQVESPYYVFAMLLGELEQELLVHPTGIHPTATQGEGVTLGSNVALDAHVHLADGVTLGNDVVLYAGVYVGRNCSIGDGTIIYPNTTIRENCTLGRECIIHCNVAIGTDGFGFTPVEGMRAKIPQVGRVEIGNQVEIGSNSAIDRATCGVTRIGDGSKIDNLVQIAHNVRIGSNTTISGMSGVAGSTDIGDNVTIAAQVGINGHIAIGNNAIIGGGAGVTGSVAEGAVVSGFPAIDHKKFLRQMMGQKRVPEALRTIRNLESRIEELEKKLNG